MKKKTITIEILEQVNNYYPYGGLMATSSSIANPVSQANVAANQPNRYNKKELSRDIRSEHFAARIQNKSHH